MEYLWVLYPQYGEHSVSSCASTIFWGLARSWCIDNQW